MIKNERVLKALYLCNLLIDNGPQSNLGYRHGKKAVLLTILLPFILLYAWYNRLKIKFKASKSYKYKLAIVAIAKNESDYIKEWLVYHKIQGVDCVILYDNDSTDTMYEVLKPFIDEGFVIYNTIHGKGKQMDAYNDAINKYGEQCQYMAIIDCDEFLLPISPFTSLVDAIDFTFKKDKCAGGIGVNWCLFGSSDLNNKPNGLVIENYTRRAPIEFDKNVHIKSIVKPCCVHDFANPHYPEYERGFYCINMEGKLVCSYYNVLSSYETIRINHYFCKSKEEWIRRRKLGRADNSSDNIRSIDEFYYHDRNEVKDESILKYVLDVKTLMGIN